MEVLLVSAALHEISETVDGGRGGGRVWKRSCSHELSGLFPEREGNHKPSGSFDAIDNSATLGNQLPLRTPAPDLELSLMILGKQVHQQHTNAIMYVTQLDMKYTGLKKDTVILSTQHVGFNVGKSKQV